MPREYSLWTDGGYRTKTKTGGWACVFDPTVPVSRGTVRQFGGPVPATDHPTNQRMELLAVIRGLELIPDNSTVTLYSDSQYVVYTMTKGWRRRANLDLWERLDSAVARHLDVAANWLPRNSVPQLDIADKIAKVMTR